MIGGPNTPDYTAGWNDALGEVLLKVGQLLGTEPVTDATTIKASDVVAAVEGLRRPEPKPSMNDPE